MEVGTVLGSEFQGLALSVGRGEVKVGAEKWTRDVPGWA